MTWRILVMVVGLTASAALAEEKKQAVLNQVLDAEGKKVYDINCMACSGPTGKGDGQAAAALNPKPRNLGDAKYMATRPVETLRKVIAEGGQSVGLSPIMIGWKTILKPEQINSVLAYVQSLTPNLGFAQNQGNHTVNPVLS